MARTNVTKSVSIFIVNMCQYCCVLKRLTRIPTNDVIVLLTALQDQLLPLLCPLTDQSQSVYELLKGLDERVGAVPLDTILICRISKY